MCVLVKMGKVLLVKLNETEEWLLAQKINCLSHLHFAPKGWWNWPLVLLFSNFVWIKLLRNLRLTEPRRDKRKIKIFLEQNSSNSFWEEPFHNNCYNWDKKVNFLTTQYVVERDLSITKLNFNLIPNTLIALTTTTTLTTTCISRIF